MELAEESLLFLGGVLLVLAGWMVIHFANPKTSIPIKLLVTISFALGFAGVALLPIDLTVTSVYDDNVDESEKGTPNNTYQPWLVTYWSTFLLAWLILPLVKECLESGEFTVLSRLRAGCRIALRGYILLVVTAIVAIVGMAIHLQSWHVIPVLMALGNTYGLLLVSLLLGYGLVDVPRQLWSHAYPEGELRRTRIVASSADEALFEAVWELQDCEALIDAALAKVGSQEENGAALLDLRYASCVDKLLARRNSTATLSPSLQRRKTLGRRRTQSEEALDTTPTIQYLAKLNSRLQHAQANIIAAEQTWNAIVAKNKLYSDLVEGSIPRPQRREPAESTWNAVLAGMGCCASYLRFVWLKWLRAPFYLALGISCAFLSVMVLWSEATLSFPFNASPFALLLGVFDSGESKDRGVLFQLAALIPLLYMSICVYSCLFKLSLFGSYRLRGSKQSPGVALVFNAQYLVRLQFPLGYNYLYIIKYDTSATDCAFSHVMSNMSTVPFFGTSFSVYAPLLILALCGFTLCNGYARFLAALGIEHEDAILIGDQETLDSKVNEGITLLRRRADPPLDKQDSRRALELV